MMNHSIKDNLTSNHATTNSMWTRIMAVLIALITTATAWAEVGEFFIVDGVKYTITNESPYEVRLEQPAVDGLVELKIPSTVTPEGSYAKYKVTSIVYNAFLSYKSLTSVTIGSNVTSIGEQAFYGCTGLKKVTIGSAVTSIEKDAFKGCTNLDEVICLPDASELTTWNDYDCDDFKGSKNSKTTVCYVSSPSKFSSKFSNVNVTEEVFKSKVDEAFRKRMAKTLSPKAIEECIASPVYARCILGCMVQQDTCIG